MDIDNAGKFKGKGKQNKVNKIQKYDSNNQEHERNTRKGKEEKDKYCYICDMNNPDTNEWYFNWKPPKNPTNSNNQFNKYYNENKKGK